MYKPQVVSIMVRHISPSSFLFECEKSPSLGTIRSVEVLHAGFDACSRNFACCMQAVGREESI